MLLGVVIKRVVIIHTLLRYVSLQLQIHHTSQQSNNCHKPGYSQVKVHHRHPYRYFFKLQCSFVKYLPHIQMYYQAMGQLYQAFVKHPSRQYFQVLYNLPISVTHSKISKLRVRHQSLICHIFGSFLFLFLIEIDSMVLKAEQQLRGTELYEK